jgi:hypothetical protein
MVEITRRLRFALQATQAFIQFVDATWMGTDSFSSSL